MKIRIVIITIMVLLSPTIAWAIGEPVWLKHLPKPNNDTYYYRVTKAEGHTYEEAYTKAFSMAILESQWKIGVKVNKSSNLQTIEETITSDLNLQSSNMNLPLNKVCEYEKASPNISNGVVLYILWQVARYGNVKTEFEDYLDCE